MIDYESIENTLALLDNEYNIALNSDTIGTQLPILFSKLAVLELCGWIEVSIDIILYEYVNNQIDNVECKNGIESIIRKNNGFNYQSNLFPLFCAVLGIKNLENVLNKIQDGNLENLKNITNTYSQERNKAAHTDTPEGTTRSYKAPNNVLNDFRLLKPAIQEFETTIKELSRTITNTTISDTSQTA